MSGLTQHKCTQMLNHTFCVLLQSPDGKYLASGAIDGIINIFDIATGKLLHTLEGIVLVIYSTQILASFLTKLKDIMQVRILSATMANVS